MALVKTSKIAVSRKRSGLPPKVQITGNPKQLGQPQTLQAKAAERIAAATEEVAAGMTQAAAAASTLRSAMVQIAVGAEEASGASLAQHLAIKSIVGNLNAARDEVDLCERRTANVESVLADTADQIANSIRAIENHAARQQANLDVIKELARRAESIGEITHTVSRIADQTNLLALNAAIEAARAGDQGRGFAVVAEQVMSLAGNSEKSAQQVLGFSRSIQEDVGRIVSGVTAAAEISQREAKTGIAIVERLGAMRGEMALTASTAKAIFDVTVEINRAANETQAGASQVASASQEQAAAAEEVQKAIQEQTSALDQGQQTSEALAKLAQSLLSGKAGGTVHQIGAAAEEFSATIQELSIAAGQIMMAVEQIDRGSQQQASATEQSSAAVRQIDQGAKQALELAEIATNQVEKISASAGGIRASIKTLIDGVSDALTQTKICLGQIDTLQQAARQIEKIVDKITLVALRTMMLAVSGAIEAARTGDAGRGFAMVSSDIRALAEEATDRVDQVKDKVRSIIEQIGSVRRNLEQLADSSTAEVEKNRDLLSALDKVEGELAALATAGISIRRGAQSIEASVAETLNGAQQVAIAAAGAGLAARQAATAANEQARGAEDLAAAVEEIALLADQLNNDHG